MTAGEGAKLHDAWSVQADPRFLKHPQDSSTDRLSPVGGDVDVRFHASTMDQSEQHDHA